MRYWELKGQANFLHCQNHEWHSGLVVSPLDQRLRGLGLRLGHVTVLSFFWQKNFIFIVPLTIQEYKWVPPYCQLSPKRSWGISLQCIGIPSGIPSHLTTQEYKWVPPYCQLSPKKCWGISVQCIGIPSGIPSHLTTQEYKWVPPYCQLSPKKCWGISVQCIGIPSGIPSHLTTKEYKWVPPYCQLSPKNAGG